MNVARHLVIWCSVVVCVNTESNLTLGLHEDDFDVSSLEDDDDFDFGPDLRFLSDFGESADDNSTNVNGTDKSDPGVDESVNSGGSGKNQSDLQNDGSERVVTPVAFSYSSSSNPSTIPGGGTRVVINHPNNVGHRQFTQRPEARFRSRPLPATSYSHALVPMIYHAQQPLQTTLDGERLIASQQEPEEPSHPRGQQYEEDDGGGGEETEDEEEESSDGEEDYDEEEQSQGNGEKRAAGKDYDYYSYPEEHQERLEASDVVEQKKDPETVAKEFLEEYDPRLGYDRDNKGDSTQGFQVQEEIVPLKRPKKHQKIEDGMDKVLQKPLKFAYNEDSSPAASGHKKHHKGGKYEQGGGEEGHADHHTSHGKKGDKGYKGYHKYEKGQKGHHDKETKEKEYSDHKGKKAKHKDTGGHVAKSVKAEKGKKGAEYEEKGEHKKGHSTKGEHNIHKKDEYVKKHEFYDEHHEGGEHEKHGGYHEKHAEKKGGKYKKGHKKAGYHDDHHGKKGHHEKGGHHDEHKGHKEKKGEDEHHAHAEKYGKKHGHKEGKKWHFDKKER